MHAVQRLGLPAVDLQDHLVGLLQPGLVVAHRGGGDEGAVLADAGHFHHGHVDVAEEPEPGVLGHVAEVDVDVVQGACVDALAHVGVRLVGQPEFHAFDLGQSAVKLGGGGGTGEDLDPEAFARIVGPLHPPRQRLRNRLGVTGASEAAHRHSHARRDALRGSFGGDDAVAEQGVADAIGHV